MDQKFCPWDSGVQTWYSCGPLSPIRVDQIVPKFPFPTLIDFISLSLLQLAACHNSHLFFFPIIACQVNLLIKLLISINTYKFPS